MQNIPCLAPSLGQNAAAFPRYSVHQVCCHRRGQRINEPMKYTCLLLLRVLGAICAFPHSWSILSEQEGSAYLCAAFSWGATLCSHPGHGTVQELPKFTLIIWRQWGQAGHADGPKPWRWSPGWGKSSAVTFILPSWPLCSSNKMKTAQPKHCSMNKDR